MKNIKSLFSIALLCALFSCGKNFNELNVDPNNPQNVPAEFLFTAAEKTIADQTYCWDQAYFGYLWGQYFSQNNYTEESRYLPRPEAVNFRWEWYYADALYDLEETKKLVIANPGLDAAADKNKLAVVEILAVMRWHDLTDIFGPIPYSEALKGAANKTPKYDSQEAIYTDLLRRLEAAVGSMDESTGSFGQADAIYFGDVAKWKKLGNTLRLRIAMRMADANASAAQTVVETAFSGAFTSNDDNAYFHFLTGTPNSNTLHQNRIQRIDADFGMSNVLIDNTLLPLNDPRLPAYADEKAAGGGYLGRPFGQNGGNAAAESPDLYSQPSGAEVIRNGGIYGAYDVFAPDALGRLVSYAEVCFILAEAKERGWNVPGSAQVWYENGIRASLGEWGVDYPSTVTSYLNQTSVAYNTASGDWKQKIGVQKWIALYLQGTQGWCEWRRLDFEKFQLPVDGAILSVGDKVAPVRLTYPTDEQTQNSVNYQAAKALLGGDDLLSTRVWWDVF